MINIDDRFSFDDLFRKLLREGYDHEEVKDIILGNCSLGPIVAQERIENEYYLAISKNEEVSMDLLQDYKSDIAKILFCVKQNQIL